MDTMEDTTTTETTSSAPTSFAEAASALEASSASTPDATTTAESTAPAATTQAATDAAPGLATTDPQPPKGAPPEWRWQDIKESLRKKTAEETEARVRQEVEQQYAGLKDFTGLTAEQRNGLLIWNRALSGDPAARAHVAQAAQSDPQLATALRGLIASETRADDTEPEADLQTGDGTQVYSKQAQRARDEWLTRRITQQITDQFTQRFQPLAEVAQEHQARKADEQQKAASTQWAKNVLAPIARLPHFAEFKPEIAKALAAPENAGKDLAEVVWDTYAALHTAKVNGLSQHTRTSVLADIHAKTQASTVNPSQTALGTRPKLYANFEDAAKAMEAGAR